MRNDQKTFKSIRGCPFKKSGFKDIDYKNVDVIKEFITERGKILPRRITGVSAFFQRKLAKSVKRARNMGLLPFLARD